VRASLEGGQPSSEAGPYSRGRPALERGGASPDGGVQPSSEAEPHPMGASSPRARRSFVSAVAYPSSEAEFRPRVAGAVRSGGPLRLSGPWAPAVGP
jgi:hypothetical protein